MAIESNLWFEEILEMQAGRTMKIKIEDLIEAYDSKFQRIEVYKTRPFGKMLVLDGVIMLTEWDECGYHEMLAHVPMSTHPCPENICIIGGGDGGTMKEVLKHSTVKTVDICEIDGDVIRLSQKHFPELASSFDDSRVTVHTADGAKFVAENKNAFDIILVDSSDPIGPAEVLFSEQFYMDMKESLREDGIAVTQSESFFYHESIVAKLTGYAKKHYAAPSYYYTMVPTYPSGMIGFTFCSKKYDGLKDMDDTRTASMRDTLNYYNPHIHRGAFALPEFVRRRVNF
ncbi:MAG: polyamine aminopropyltransferase [Spirochaetota bacterium]